LYFLCLCAGAKALKKGLQPRPPNAYGGAYGMQGFGMPRGATCYYSDNMPIAMAAPIRWQPPVALPSGSQQAIALPSQPQCALLPP
jgi:hypothetical protein